MSSPKPKAKTLADFRAAHDKSFIIPQKIKDGLAKLGDGWEYELDFMRMIGVGTTDIAAYREQFADYFVLVGGRNPKRCWTGSKAVAAKMREMGGG